MNTHVISRRSLLQYGFLALPVAFAGFPLYVLAPDFYATRYGLSLSLLGTLLLAIRLFDAVQDPLIGWVADALHGRFLPLITIAGAALCLAVMGLFNIIIFSPAIWFSLCMVVAVTAYSVLVIALGAQATLWTVDPQLQTRIAAARECSALIGLVIAVSLPVVLRYLVDPKRVFLWYAAVLALLMATGISMFARLSRTLPRPKIAAAQVSRSLMSGVRALPRHSLQLFAVYALNMLAASIPAVLVIFFVRDLLGAEHLTGVFLLLYFLCGALGMPLWKRISADVGKYKAWAFSSLLAVAGFIGALLLDAGDIGAYAIVCIVSGLALGADLTLPPSMLADQIHAQDNSAYSATHYACLAFIAKASLALASAIALPLLDAVDFKPQSSNTAFALATLALAYALVPCILKLIATVLLYFYFIRAPSGGNHEAMQDHRNYRSSHHA